MVAAAEITDGADFAAQNVELMSGSVVVGPVEPVYETRRWTLRSVLEFCAGAVEDAGRDAGGT